MAGGWSARARMSGPLVEYVEGFELGLGRAGDVSAFLVARCETLRGRQVVTALH